jgi:hypothetical protein
MLERVFVVIVKLVNGDEEHEQRAASKRRRA